MVTEYHKLRCFSLSENDALQHGIEHSEAGKCNAFQGPEVIKNLQAEFFLAHEC